MFPVSAGGDDPKDTGTGTGAAGCDRLALLEVPGIVGAVLVLSLAFMLVELLLMLLPLKGIIMGEGICCGTVGVVVAPVSGVGGGAGGNCLGVWW